MKILACLLIWISFGSSWGAANSVSDLSGPATLDSNETTPVPQPVPHPKPPPPPPPPRNQVTDAMVYETKVYAVDGTEYQRFGHAIAAFGSSVAVGSSKESIAPSVSLFSVQVSSASSQLSRTPSSYNNHEIEYSHSSFVNVTWTEEAEYSAPSASDIDYYDGYGQSVAMNAQSLVVGAPYSNVLTSASGSAAAASSGYSVGTAHAFSLDSGTAQTLSPSTVYTNMQFASALSLQNATLAVGAPGASATGQMSGAVYVFQYDSESSEWAEEAEIVDEDGGAAYAKFGSSVCLSNDATLLAIGASGYSKHVIHGGAVFLYQKTASILNTSAAAVGDNTTHNGTGNSTTSAQPTQQPTEQPAEQVKYTWELQSLLVPSSLAAYAYFGQTVAFRDSIGLVSALDESGSGVVYLYQQQVTTQSARTMTGFLRASHASNSYPAVTWVLTSILTPNPIASPANKFGASLAIFHTNDAYSRYTDESGAVELQEAYVLAVGAPGDSVGSVSANSVTADYAGAVYLYLGPHGSDGSGARRPASSAKSCRESLHCGASSTAASDEFALMTKVLANDSTAYNYYGSSLALMGAHLLVGAELADTATAARAGAVYLETNLIPYLVAATQQAEQEPPDEDDDDDGGSGGDGDSSGSTEKSGWAAFLAFIGTSGGMVTMSFLPIAVLAILFVAHARATGKKLEFNFSKASCCAPALGGSGDGPKVSVGAHARSAGSAGSASQVPLVGATPFTATTSDAQGKATKRSPKSEAASVPAASTVHNVLQIQKRASLDSVDLEQQPLHLQPPESSADTTPSFWQRVLYYARHPWLLRSAVMHTKLAADAGTGTDAASPPSSPADRTIPAPAAGKDLRLRPVTPDKRDLAQELSIRSPITHIPLHSSLVMSPHQSNAVPVRSYRFTTATVTAATGGDLVKENLLPSALTGSDQQTDLLGQNSELQRLKERLNAEFIPPVTTPPSPLSGPRSAVEPERVTLLAGGSSPGATVHAADGASSAPKPATTSSAAAAPSAAIASTATGDRKKGKIAATIRV